MTGMSRTLASGLSFPEHLAQSIGDILSTPIGSRVLRRTYGSELPRLIDAPMNGETIVDLYMATAEALDLWEPRFKLRRVEVEQVVRGALNLTLTGEVAGRDQVIDVQVRA